MYHIFLSAKILDFFYSLASEPVATVWQLLMLAAVVLDTYLDLPCPSAAVLKEASEFPHDSRQTSLGVCEMDVQRY